MKISEIMTRKVVVVQLDTTVEQIQQLFKLHGFHHLLVVGGDSLIGVISDRDLLRNVSPFMGNAGTERPQDVSLLHRRAHQIMTRKPVSISADASIQEAAQRMLERKISCLPVVNARGYPIGIVSSRDLLRELSRLATPAPNSADSSAPANGQ